jgi:DHA1 family bicyclomycin/chloramphenicol resistance-like MFS transporter
VIRTAATGYGSVMLALALVRSLGIDSLPVMASFLFVGYGFLGLVIPTSAVLAMEKHGRIAGTASALMGTLQFVTSAVIVGIGSAIFDGTSRPMITIIGTCAAIVFVLTIVTLRRRDEAVVAAGE